MAQPVKHLPTMWETLLPYLALSTTNTEELNPKLRVKSLSRNESGKDEYRVGRESKERTTQVKLQKW